MADASGVENVPALLKELADWRSVGWSLWPMVRLWPVSGACGSDDLAIVETLGRLLGETGNVGVDTEALQQTVRRETIDEVVEYLEASGKIKRVNPTERSGFLDGIRALKQS